MKTVQIYGTAWMEFERQLIYIVTASQGFLYSFTPRQFHLIVLNRYDYSSHVVVGTSHGLSVWHPLAFDKAQLMEFGLGVLLYCIVQHRFVMLYILQCNTVYIVAKLLA